MAFADGRSLATGWIYRFAAYAQLNMADDAAILALIFC